MSRLGMGKGLGGDTAETADPSYHTTLCAALKAQGKKDKVGHIHGYGICPPMPQLRVPRPYFSGSVWTSACR